MIFLIFYDIKNYKFVYLHGAGSNPVNSQVLFDILLLILNAIIGGAISNMMKKLNRTDNIIILLKSFFLASVVTRVVV